MKQFWIYSLTALGIAIFDLIDSAFGNSLGIDSICVMSAFLVITWCASAVGNLGKYAYDVKQTCLTECIIMQVGAASIAALIIGGLSKQLPHIYKLTDKQYELMSKCLLCYSAFLVIKQTAGFFKNYITIQCRNKVIVISNILFYVCMIAFDTLVIVFKGECWHLVLTTGISYFVLFIYCLTFGKIISDMKRPSVTRLKECCKCAKDILFDRLWGKVATVTFNICASHLGTELYALHGIGYNIATSAEYITDEWYRMQIVKLHGIDNWKEKLKEKKKLQKKMFLPSVFLSYLLMFILIIPLHGQTDLKTATFISSLYLVEQMLLCPYENSRGFLTSIGDTKSLQYGGLIGILVRVPISIISLMTPIGIYGFAFGSGIDFFVRGLYYTRECTKAVKKWEQTQVKCLSSG